VLILCVASAAQARERIRFEYAREATQCPDERVLETAIAGRLGYSPFDADAPRKLSARVFRLGAGLGGELELFDEKGARIGRRAFDSPTLDCAELAAAIELALAIAIDPQAAAVQHPEPAPRAAPAPSPIAPAPALPPAAPPPPPESMHFAVALLGGPTIGLSPSIAVGFGISVAIRYRLIEAQLEGRADLPSTAAVVRDGAMVGTVRSDVLLGSLLVCGVYRWFGACASGSAGALQVVGDVVEPSTRQTALLVTAGARLLVRFELGRGIVVQPFVDAALAVTRATITSGPVTIWATSPVVGQLGVALRYQLF
jgi:hypothetical protein